MRCREWVTLLALALAARTAALTRGSAPNSEYAASHFLGIGAFYYVWYDVDLLVAHSFSGLIGFRYGSPESDGAYMHWNHSVLPHWNSHIRAQHAGNIKNSTPAWSERIDSFSFRQRCGIYSAL
jgi:hypothetical protein